LCSLAADAYPGATTGTHLARRHGVRTEREYRNVIRLSLGLAALAMAAAAALAPAAPARAAGLPAHMVQTKTIRYCSAVNLPPMEFMNAQTQPTGVDIDLGDALAAQLGVKPVWINMPFAGLIPALLADHCDAIISQLFIKPGRLKVIDEIPYMISHEAVIMKAGAPKIPTVEGLSGRKAATVTGTTATNLLEEANEKLKAAGKPLIDIVMFPENTQALQQVQFGQVAAYGVAYETARYYAHIAPTEFEIGGPPYYRIPTGIGLSKENQGLNAALRGALANLMKDGSYAKIFDKWDLQIDMLDKN
jgi:polar amino acid transport system substrate-binding protein